MTSHLDASDLGVTRPRATIRSAHSVTRPARPMVLRLSDLDAYNAGVKAAVEYNRRRPQRERWRQLRWGK